VAPPCTVSKNGTGLPRGCKPLQAWRLLPQRRGRASASRRSPWPLSQDSSPWREEELGPAVPWASPRSRPLGNGALCMKQASTTSRLVAISDIWWTSAGNPLRSAQLRG
jgi:hypothetical protein